MTVCRSPENELIQRRLLQFMDGTVVTMKPSTLTGGETIRFDTAGLLFVVAGAFSDLLKEIGAETTRGCGQCSTTTTSSPRTS